MGENCVLIAKQNDRWHIEMVIRRRDHKNARLTALRSEVK